MAKLNSHSKPLGLDWAERFRTQLSRKSLVSPSRWATKYRVMGENKPWAFRTHPWLKEMHDSQAEYNIGKKAAQVGYTETLLNIALYNLDIPKRHVLYILPNQRPDASDFAARAINPACELSPHIAQMFSGADNSGLKQAGVANFYIRGSNSRASLKSVPANVLLFDEFEEHETSLTKLAEERASGQEWRLDWKVSTPMAPNSGISALYNRSTREQFEFPCPSCRRWTTLRFPDSLVITADDPDDPRIKESHLICTECKVTLHHHDKPDFLGEGKWVAQTPGQLMRGFHISQLYSTALPPYAIARLFLEANKDVAAEQEFWNSKLGLEHLTDGAQLDDDILNGLIQSYRMVDAIGKGYTVTMGIDVGKVLHVVICIWDTSDTNPIDINAGARCKVMWAGELDTFAQAAKLMVEYNVDSAIVDIMPEVRQATDFANAFYGRVKTCRYSSNETSKSIFGDKNSSEISVNRTSWLDQTLGRFRNKSILLPMNLPRDFFKHLKQPMRAPTKDKRGNTVYRYQTETNAADHYAHALNYAEIGLAFATGSNAYITLR